MRDRGWVTQLIYNNPWTLWFTARQTRSESISAFNEWISPNTNYRSRRRKGKARCVRCAAIDDAGEE